MIEKILLSLLILIEGNSNFRSNKFLENKLKEEIVDTNFGYKIFENAKKYIGVKYKFEGRSKHGLDCMGVIFLAYSETTNKNWKTLSVYPSKLVKSGFLGYPVKGLDGIILDDNNFDEVVSKMKVGDIVYFIVPFEVGKDKPLAIINGKNYWCLHMAIYAGNNCILHANPFIDESHKAEVIIESIKNFVNRTNIKGLFVTRITK